MAFLDNSGGIILDAVLTDTGRYRLAKGDGSFKITKFALADDEIDYSLYNKTHSSGSAYFDLEVLQSPVLEAFTNNASSMKSKLLSISRTDLLYLPMIKVNDQTTSTARYTSLTDSPYLVAVDSTTETAINSAGSTQGIINGETLGSSTFIRLDQGLDTTEKSPAFSLDEDLVETGYIVEVDNRFATVTTNGGVSQTYSFLDDDNMASYVFNRDVDTDLVRDNAETDTVGTEVISGPRGTILEFSLKSSLDLNTGNFLFTEIGSTDAATFSGKTLYYLDTNVRVTGLTTGYRVDVPVRFYKCSSC